MLADGVVKQMGNWSPVLSEHSLNGLGWGLHDEHSQPAVIARASCVAPVRE